MLAISRLDISYAYPFTALTFIFIVAGGHILFNEPASIGKLLGSILVLSGLLVISKTG
jgi:multidrug transporter EmrE-like cation transporter